MSAMISAVRNTCFAILSAIETDVRSLIDYSLSQLTDGRFLPDDVREVARGRFAGDINTTLGATPETDADLLDYSDFADLSKVLHLHANAFSPHSAEIIHLVAKEMEKMAQARNRVCHSRPLEDDDLSRFHELSTLLVRSWPELPWDELKLLGEKRRTDPSFIFRLEIPSFWRIGSGESSNNLPLPDFDETGFIGRNTDRRELMKHLQGPHPVITLVGEGGIGKTALALSCAYSLLDLPKDRQFDIIVWVSLKARVLTPTGIRDIRDSIMSTIGVLQTTAQQFGSPLTGEADVESLISELHQYMGTLKVFLVVDNLETLPSDALRSFLIAIPEKSKVLITSRVGLGELELRYKLDQLDEKTSLTLLRKYARSLNLELIFRAKDDILTRYTSLLFNSPLLIKWFVSSVANGADPSLLITAKNSSFSEAITFCFENLFARLSATEKLLLYLLASARRPLTQTELIFLTQEAASGEMGTPDVERALNVFHNSSMIKRTFGDADSSGLEISLTDIASEYLSRVSPPPLEIVVVVRARLKQLREISERSIIKQAEYKYDLFAIRATTKEERIAGAYLQFALQALKRKDFELARKRLEQARTLRASWSEVYRIYSIVEDKAGNIPKALELAETAVECDPSSTVALYQFALYLLQTIEDPEQSLNTIEAAIALDPDDETVLSFKALLLTRLGRFSAAALIYEKVLLDVSKRLRRWRITTRDQAAECYRRWAQQDFSGADNISAIAHCHRAARILADAAVSGDFDHKTIDRFTHVIDDSLERALTTGDFEELKWSLQQLAGTPLTGGAVHFKRVSLDTLASAIKGNPECENLWSEYMGNVQLQAGGEDVQATTAGPALSGVVRPMQPGKKFGFIRDPSGRDWFFHESHILNGGWNSVWAGRRANFFRGKSKDGKICAVDVKLI